MSIIRGFTVYVYNYSHFLFFAFLQTRFLVTHGIGFLPQCDQIIVMDGGRITEAGPYAQLIDADGDFAEFIRTFTAVEENQEGDPCEFNEAFIHGLIIYAFMTV